MRNPFKTVYCKDCGHCMLADQHADTDSKFDYSQCKAYPKNGTSARRIGHNPKEFWYCSTKRLWNWCFRYKEAKK